jgi:hypothetical protein
MKLKNPMALDLSFGGSTDVKQTPDMIAARALMQRREDTFYAWARARDAYRHAAHRLEEHLADLERINAALDALHVDSTRAEVEPLLLGQVTVERLIEVVKECVEAARLEAERTEREKQEAQTEYDSFDNYFLRCLIKDYGMDKPSVDPRSNSTATPSGGYSPPRA